MAVKLTAFLSRPAVVRACVATLVWACGGAAISACAPRLRPLTGAPAPARLPRAVLPAGYQRVVFQWELQEGEFAARGEGVARIAPPDSARMDFVLGGGFGGGAAVLIGDTVRAPGGDMVRRLIPPPPMLWAALGRLSVPAVADTSVRVDGALLRADIGAPPSWRLTFRADSLVRLEHVRDGRIAEWVERDGARVRYRNEGSRRTLTLTVTRVDEAPSFDASIWSFR
jgi:hypothetical protein